VGATRTFLGQLLAFYGLALSFAERRKAAAVLTTWRALGVWLRGPCTAQIKGAEWRSTDRRLRELAHLFADTRMFDFFLGAVASKTTPIALEGASKNSRRSGYIPCGGPKAGENETGRSAPASISRVAGWCRIRDARQASSGQGLLLPNLPRKGQGPRMPKKLESVLWAPPRPGNTEGLFRCSLLLPGCLCGLTEGCFFRPLAGPGRFFPICAILLSLSQIPAAPSRVLMSISAQPGQSVTVE